MASGGQNKLVATSWQYGGGSVYTAETPYNNINDDKWHHIVGIISSTFSFLYIDGILIQKDETISNSPWNTSGNAPITIGGVFINNNA